MNRLRLRTALRFVLVRVVVLTAWALAPARAEGEAVGGFPSWPERVLHQWVNRARCEPAVEMTACGANCGEAACYAPMPPLAWSLALNRAARFHCDEMTHQGYFAHDSQCALSPTVGTTYPGSCDGSAACACAAPLPHTSFAARVALFGAVASGEVLATGADPNQAFYLWLFEPAPNPACAFSDENGHRWLILKSQGSMGAGVSSHNGLHRSGIDFGAAGTPGRIPSGSHYPRQAPVVQAWANWYDASAPLEAFVVVDGSWIPMSLARGTPTNGAWTAPVPGVGGGCHRYFFAFRDSGGALVTYPTTGTLGIGPAGSCADWDPAPPLVARAFCAGDGTLPTACPCGNAGASGHGCGNSQNASGAKLSASGNTAPADTLVLQASGMPAIATAACVFLQGSTRNTAGIVFGDGLRCAAGTLVRLGTKSMPAGHARYPEPGDPPLSIRGGVTPGSGVTRWYQAWYRNAALGFCTSATFNVTSGVEVRW